MLTCEQGTWIYDVIMLYELCRNATKSFWNATCYISIYIVLEWHVDYLYIYKCDKCQHNYVAWFAHLYTSN